MKAKSGNNIAHSMVETKPSPSSTKKAGQTPPLTAGTGPSSSSSKGIGVTPPYPKSGKGSSKGYK